MSKLTKIGIATRIIENECKKLGIIPGLLEEFHALCSADLGYAMLYLGLIKNPRLISHIKSKNISDEVLPLCA